jgi:hypothetical protein
LMNDVGAIYPTVVSRAALFRQPQRVVQNSSHGFKPRPVGHL